MKDFFLKNSVIFQDLNHLLEAVLILDQKGAEREMAKNPNPFPPRAVGSARGSRKSSFQASERQREIQKENERLLKVRFRGIPS